MRVRLLTFVPTFLSQHVFCGADFSKILIAVSAHVAKVWRRQQLTKHPRAGPRHQCSTLVVASINIFRTLLSLQPNMLTLFSLVYVVYVVNIAFLAEFGAYSSGSGDDLTDSIHLLGLADQNLQSWAYWQFKSYQDITTSAVDAQVSVRGGC